MKLNYIKMLLEPAKLLDMFFVKKCLVPIILQLVIVCRVSLPYLTLIRHRLSCYAPIYSVCPITPLSRDKQFFAVVSDKCFCQGVNSLTIFTCQGEQCCLEMSAFKNKTLSNYYYTMKKT